MDGHQASEEIGDLSRRFGAPRLETHILEDTSFRPLSGRRVAEVAMAIQRPNGRILLQTKEDYPGGVFRVPTGGLKRDEAIESALLRETEEETALSVDILSFAAILTYRDRDDRSIFVTYLFLLRETGGVLKPQDPDEGITGWIEADASVLAFAADQLRDVPDTWKNWGEFRALALDALLRTLDDEATPGESDGAPS